MADKMRHPVAQGGMWNTAKVEYSSQTQNLLKEMMKESKLTNFQQRQLGQAMNGGQSLPSKCHPTSSAKPRIPEPVTKRNNSAVIDPRKYNPKIRTQEQIEATGAYERESFQPSPLTKFGGFYENDKERLANIMAYGEDIKVPDKSKRPPRRARDDDEDRPDVDRFAELEKEVAERQKFLDEMEELGQGDKYRTIIQTEISQLVREMEIIDKKRTGELQRMIAVDEKRRKQLHGGAIPEPEHS